jgi:hypothetical protein
VSGTLSIPLQTLNILFPAERRLKSAQFSNLAIQHATAAIQ